MFERGETMSDGRVIRGVLFSDERVAQLKKQGLTGEFLELHLSYLHLFHQYSFANGCYDAYIQLLVGRNKIRYSSDFLNIIVQSLIDSSVISIANLIDKRLNNLNLYSLLKDIEIKRELFMNHRNIPKIVQECKKELSNEEAQIHFGKIKKHRNKVVAHKDFKKPDGLSAFTITQFTVTTPRKALEYLEPIVDRLHNLFFRKYAKNDQYYGNAGKETILILELFNKLQDQRTDI